MKSSGVILKLKRQRLDHYKSYHYDQKARERLEVLSGWLSTKFQSPNILAEIHRILADCQKTQRKNLWSGHLIANYLTRKYLEQAGEVSEQEIRVPIFSQLASAIPLTIATYSQAVQSDLNDAWHPSISDSKLLPISDPTELQSRAEVASQALDLIMCDDISGALVSNHCAALCFIAATPPLQEGQCVSLCSRSTPGIIYISSAPVIMTAESIVHESAHQMLYAETENNDLLIDANMKIKTPLRDDLRPVSSLMHQIWVLYHLVILYHQFLSAPSGVIKRNILKVQKRLNQHLDDYNAGCALLSKHEKYLTPRGIEFFRRIRLSSQ